MVRQVRIEVEPAELAAAADVVREKGRVQIGNLACSMCHTSVMPDGTAVLGAQGNFPFDAVFAAGPCLVAGTLEAIAYANKLASGGVARVAGE